MGAMSRALSIAVRARLGASSAPESSLEMLTGLPVRAVMMSRALTSCAGLRTANCDATAKASTFVPCSAIACSSAASSSGDFSSPL